MSTLNLGKIRFNWQGAYNNSTAYVPNDVVSSGGNSYICILASTGNAVSNGTYWSLMAQAGTNGTNGSNGADGTDVGTVITTQGDVLYRDGSGLQRLAKGTASQSLTMNSGATAPEWTTPASGGAWNIIGTTTASNSSSLTITGLDSTYDTYACAMADMHPASGSQPCLRMGDSSGIDSSAGNYKWQNQRMEWENGSSFNSHASNSDDEIKFTLGSAGSGSGEGWGGFFYLHRPADSQILPHISGHGSYIPASDDGFTVLFSGARSSAITLDRLEFRFGSANIVSGRFTVWGIAHA